eukprot:1139477-Pelagomonas_calceolata.AAC.5
MLTCDEEAVGGPGFETLLAWNQLLASLRPMWLCRARTQFVQQSVQTRKQRQHWHSSASRTSKYPAMSLNLSRLCAFMEQHLFSSQKAATLEPQTQALKAAKPSLIALFYFYWLRAFMEQHLSSSQKAVTLEPQTQTLKATMSLTLCRLRAFMEQHLSNSQEAVAGKPQTRP